MLVELAMGHRQPSSCSSAAQRRESAMSSPASPQSLATCSSNAIAVSHTRSADSILVAIHQGLNATVTHIFMAKPAQQIVEQAFAQGSDETSICSSPSCSKMPYRIAAPTERSARSSRP